MANLPALTSLRFFLALWVFMLHAAMVFPNTPLAANRVAWTGYAAVSCFFILSGFILAHAYLARPERFRPLAFYRARFARIYPTYLIGILLGLVTLPPIALRGIFRELFLNLFLVQAWNNGSYVPLLNPPGWSLSAEAFFYLSLPLFGMLLARLSAKHIFIVLGLIVALIWIPPFAGIAAYSPHFDRIATQPYFSDGGLMGLLQFNPLIRLPEFLLGICLGLLHIRRKNERRSSYAILTYGGIALFTALIFMAEHIPFIIMHNALPGIPFSLILIGLALMPSETRLARVLSRPMLILLGNASYALYIVHFPVIRAVYAFGYDGITGVLVSLAAAIALAVLIYLHYEKPLRALLNPAPRHD